MLTRACTCSRRPAAGGHRVLQPPSRLASTGTAQVERAMALAERSYEMYNRHRRRPQFARSGAPRNLKRYVEQLPLDDPPAGDQKPG
jgi:hypothetical protein